MSTVYRSIPVFTASPLPQPTQPSTFKKHPAPQLQIHQPPHPLHQAFSNKLERNHLTFSCPTPFQFFISVHAKDGMERCEFVVTFSSDYQHHTQHRTSGCYCLFLRVTSELFDNTPPAKQQRMFRPLPLPQDLKKEYEGESSASILSRFELESSKSEEQHVQFLNLTSSLCLQNQHKEACKQVLSKHQSKLNECVKQLLIVS